jgi:pilus assembly protein Flp/PilA
MMTSFSARTVRRIVRRFRGDEGGTTAIEYALVAAGISVAIISTVFGAGSNLKSSWYDKIAAIFN